MVVVVATYLMERTPLHPILRWRPLVYVGVTSYGIYLLHMLCANVDWKIIHQQYGIALFAAALITVIALAELPVFRNISAASQTAYRNSRRVGRRRNLSHGRRAAIRTHRRCRRRATRRWIRR